MIIKPTLVCKNKMYFIYITIFLNSHTYTCTLKRNLKMVLHPTLVCKESYYKQILFVLYFLICIMDMQSYLEQIIMNFDIFIDRKIHNLLLIFHYKIINTQTSKQLR